MSEPTNCLGAPTNEGACLEVIFLKDGRVKYRFHPETDKWPTEATDCARLIGTLSLITHQVTTWFATRMQAAMLVEQAVDAKLMNMLATWQPNGEEN